MLVLLEVGANLILIKPVFDPDLGAVWIGEESHDTGKQISQVYFSARTQSSNLACIFITFLKLTHIHSKY